MPITSTARGPCSKYRAGLVQNAVLRETLTDLSIAFNQNGTEQTDNRTNSGPRLLPTNISPCSINTITTLMPAHRSPSTTVRTQAQQRPYKVPVIVISSDEEEGPRPPPPKRNPRKHHKRAKPEPAEVVEISEEKHEHLDSERMQRRCHELEQVYAARFHANCIDYLYIPSF